MSIGHWRVAKRHLARGTPLAQGLRNALAKRHTVTLEQQWQDWLAENALRGASDEQLVAALTEQRVPAHVAWREVVAIRRSAGYRVAQRAERQRRQLLARAHVLSRLRKNASDVERLPSLSEEVFFTRYYATNTPVVLTHAIAEWPALKKWTPEYLGQRYGSVEIEIVEGRAGDPYCDRQYERVKRSTTMGEYARRVVDAGKTNDFYFIARNKNVELEGLSSLRDDIQPLPPFIHAERGPGAQSFWFGPHGSMTALHHDPTNIFFCQVYGRKRFTLAPPTDVGFLRFAQGYYSAAVEDFAHYEELASSQWFDVELSPGEALFIPALWWHRVEALSVSISFSLLHFKRENRFVGYAP